MEEVATEQTAVNRRRSADMCCGERERECMSVLALASDCSSLVLVRLQLSWASAFWLFWAGSRQSAAAEQFICHATGERGLQLVFEASGCVEY